MKDRYGEDGVQVELVGGAGGVFDVEIDGSRIYSKHETGHFPRYREIVTKLEELKLKS